MADTYVFVLEAHRPKGWKATVVGSSFDEVDRATCYRLPPRTFPSAQWSGEKRADKSLPRCGGNTAPEPGAIYALRPKN